ncbi:flagellin [Magnetovibrio sp.]|uniref:flagellin N-terminal helical domain-containing protein n=1 Tax=Magnetovibrio sp. TaxID=2024836 RepID=UPI002F92CD1F
MADVTLSAAVRGSLLSLQGTTNLIDRTQGRLSTGLKVASAIDDPVAFFQAKTLTDRAFDFTEKKDGIDQGVSTVTAAIDGLNAVESIVRQLKGVAQSLKSATGTQFTDLITQFNDLRAQIDLLTADATYQGTNLINGTGQTLSTEFSDITTSKLSISSVDVTSSGLNVTDVTAISTAANTLNFSYDAVSAASTLSNGDTVSITYVGSDVTLTTASSAQTFTYGTVSLSIGALTAGSASISLVNGTTYTLTIATSNTVNTLSGTTLTVDLADASAGVAIAAVTAKQYVAASNSTSVDTQITKLNDALTTLRSKTSSLGSNVALLQTRLDFTQSYVNTLEEGGSKLTLADINEEGANLLALQTRQQLGIQSLSFAGQAEQSVLGLFR